MVERVDTECGYGCRRNNDIGFSNDGSENVGSDDYGMLKVRTDCKAACDLLIAERLKAMQLALDRGSVMSKIEDIEKIAMHSLSAFM